jgi:transcriptional pleiotropic regulator of transition state genes
VPGRSDDAGTVASFARGRDRDDFWYVLTRVGARRIDDLGRIVFPANFRKALGVNSGDLLAIHLEGDRVFVMKEAPACAICHRTRNLRPVRDRHLCARCRNEAMAAD